MGEGKWSTATYAGTTARNIATGSTFAYSGTTKSTLPQAQWKAHTDLDPHGVDVRESRDSTEHPESLAIAVLFDVTGSMSTIPGELQKELPKLLGHLTQNGYVEHPQILFGAIGDATCDRVGLQVSQFESDNRMDDHLDKIFLESGGGGQNTESYELGLYFMARHTALDCVEKRNHKGYLILIGDEKPYPTVDKSLVSKVMGYEPQDSPSFEDILAEAQQKYEIYYLLPTWANHGTDSVIIDFWKGALGANFLTFDNSSEIVDKIGLTIATQEAVKGLPSLLNP